MCPVPSARRAREKRWQLRAFSKPGARLRVGAHDVPQILAGRWPAWRAEM